ncbi:MAG TPA: type II secretion system F family protein [Gemmataceae bacterium]|nr:type II secretion system F family protein [Gemmataceae bacterium]
MLFATKLPLSSLIEFCRVLRHNLGAGLTLLHVFRQQAERGPRPVRPIADRISQDLEQGESLEVALKREQAAFPHMFVAMATVGEQTGCMPDVFAELEKYFVLQQKLRRQFFSQIAWPLLQFFAAPFVIALMLFVLAIFDSPMTPLGPAYKGVWGAAKFLLHFFGTIAALVAGYYVITHILHRRPTVHALLLRLPVIGPCLSAIALSRFCLALRLTMNTGMPITKALRLSMRATGNDAFAVRAERAMVAVKEGEDLAQALRETRVFPEDFLDILANAEEGGRVPEVMEHQMEHYTEESRRRLSILTHTASGMIWLAVAGTLIFLIFSIFLSIYGPGGVYDRLAR